MKVKDLKFLLENPTDPIDDMAVLIDGKPLRYYHNIPDGGISLCREHPLKNPLYPKYVGSLKYVMDSLDGDLEVLIDGKPIGKFTFSDGETAFAVSITAEMNKEKRSGTKLSFKKRYYHIMSDEYVKSLDKGAKKIEEKDK